MSTDTTPAESPRTRAHMTRQYDAYQRDIKSLVKKGGANGENLSPDEVDRLNTLLDERDQLELDIKALPDTKSAYERVSAGDEFLKPVRPAFGHGGEVPGNRSDRKSMSDEVGEKRPHQGEYVAADADTEAVKFAKQGPFQSLGHFAYAVKAAGERPGVNPVGTLGEWYQGFARHDEAYKAMAVKGLNDADARSVKSATGLNEFSDSEGAILIPTGFAAGIWQRAMNQENLLSRISTTPVLGNTWTVRAVQDSSRADGQRFGGVSSYWTGEAQQYASSKPTYRTIELKLNKLTALVYQTEEVMADAPALSADVTRFVSEEFTFKINEALTNGTGAGMPLGYLSAGCKVTQAAVSGQGAGTITATNIDNMWVRRAKPNGLDYIWIGNQEIEPQLQQLNYNLGSSSVAAQWLFIPAGGISGQPLASLKGRPILFTEQASALGTEGDLTLFDPTQYAAIVKSTGIDQAVSMHLRFDYGEVAFRFSVRLDAKPYWDKALTRYKGSNTLSPIITLSGSRS